VNAAGLKSARLQRVLKVLREPGEHSSLELVMRAKVVAVNSIVAELRTHGAVIDCRQRCDGPNGERRFYYTLKKGPQKDG